MIAWSESTPRRRTRADMVGNDLRSVCGRIRRALTLVRGFEVIDCRSLCERDGCLLSAEMLGVGGHLLGRRPGGRWNRYLEKCAEGNE